MYKSTSRDLISIHTFLAFLSVLGHVQACMCHDSRLMSDYICAYTHTAGSSFTS